MADPSEDVEGVMDNAADVEDIMFEGVMVEEDCCSDAVL